MLKITSFTVEYRAHALGIDEPRPRFSWVLGSDRQNTFQSSYTLTVKAGIPPSLRARAAPRASSSNTRAKR